MTVFLAVVAALAGGVLGWFGTAFGAIFFAQMLGASMREGAVAMGAFMTVGPVGGLIIAGLSAWGVVKLRKGKDGPNSTRNGFLALIAVTVAAAGGYLYLFYDPQPDTFDYYKGKPILHYEVKVPKSAIREDDSFKVRVEVETFRTFLVPLGRLAIRAEGGDAIISGRTSLIYKVDNRVLNVWVSPGFRHLFDLHLGKMPEGRTEFGDWRPVDRINDRRKAKTTPGSAADGFFMRTKLIWPGPPRH